MGRRKVIRRAIWGTIITLALAVTLTVLLVRYSSVEHKINDFEVPDLPACVMRGPLCQGPLCCNKTVAEVFSEEQFNTFFPNRNMQLAKAQGFYQYHDFILASEMFARKGFGLMGGEEMQKREIAAFFAHVAWSTTCGYTTAPGGGYYFWGLCYNENPDRSQLFCAPSLLDPCVEGVSYHGRGAMLTAWNYNYNWIGLGMKLDLLHHPEYLQFNGTLAFASALYYWMTPRNGRPSPHSVMVGQWKPTLNDTLANRLPGFGLTINILHHIYCGTSRFERDQIIGHYETFLGLLHDVTPGDNKDCDLQGQWLTDADHSTA